VNFPSWRGRFASAVSAGAAGAEAGSAGQRLGHSKRLQRKRTCDAGRAFVVTPSMLSGWELGRHAMSIGHRKTLYQICGQPPEILFPHQDAGLRAAAPAPTLRARFRKLRESMLATVNDARECLMTAGSRSRDAEYPAVIEAVLAERPGRGPRPGSAGKVPEDQGSAPSWGAACETNADHDRAGRMQ
jgi:hypothetical protein